VRDESEGSYHPEDDDGDTKDDKGLFTI
jgi:hypothetical protein